MLRAVSAEPQNLPEPTYVVLKDGETIGPLSEADFNVGLESGRFSPDDMVRNEASPVWTRIRKLTVQPAVSSEARPLGWAWLARTAWAMLRADASEQPLRLGLVGIGVGLVALFLSQWTLLIWLPWLVLAATLGTFQLVGGRLVRGLFLLGLPVAISLYVMMHSVETPPARIEQPVPIAAAAPPAPAFPATISPEPAPPVTVPQQVALLPDAKIEREPAALAVPSPTPSTPVPASPTPSPVAALPPHVPELDKPGEASAHSPGFMTQVTDWWKSVANSVPAVGSKTEGGPVALPTPKAELPPLKAAGEKSDSPAASGDLLQQHRNAFVVVKGANGSGSGFVCRMNGTTWLFTNIHVAAGIKGWRLTRLDGSQLQPGASFAGGPRDAVRMALASDESGAFEVISDFDRNVTIGDQVEVLGNAEGAGVVTNLPGEVTGIGPDRIEVTAQFVPGNSGSPIVHVKTGKVIGIATYLSKRNVDFDDKNQRKDQSGDEDKWRRFGYRLDNVPKWEPVVWGAFQGEAEQLRKIELLTSDLFGLLRQSRLTSTSGIETDALRRPTADWLAVMQRSRLSPADRATANTRFLSELRGLVRNDVVAAEAQLRYSYFRERLQRERQIRDVLYQDFDTELRRRTAPRL